MSAPADSAPDALARRTGRRIALVIAGWAVYALLLGLLPVRAAAEAAAPAPVGRAVWDRAGCATCHSLYGLGGHLGPDLTDAHGRLGAPALRAIVRHGGTVMPAFPLEEADLDALLAFLAETDAGGSFAPRSLGDPPFGS